MLESEIIFSGNPERGFYSSSNFLKTLDELEKGGLAMTVGVFHEPLVKGYVIHNYVFMVKNTTLLYCFKDIFIKGVEDSSEVILYGQPSSIVEAEKILAKQKESFEKSLADKLKTPANE